MEKDVYLRCNMFSDDPIGLHIENFSKHVDKDTIEGLIKKLSSEVIDE